jgi:hypothetical protein
LGQSQQDEVIDVKIGSSWQVFREECKGGAGLGENLVDHRCDSAREGGNEEDLYNLENEVPRLGFELDLTVSDCFTLEGFKWATEMLEVLTIASELSHESTNDWDQCHQDCQHHSGKKTSDNTKDDLWDTQNPLEPREAAGQVVDVGDETDKCN